MFGKLLNRFKAKQVIPAPKVAAPQGQTPASAPASTSASLPVDTGASAHARIYKSPQEKPPVATGLEPLFPAPAPSVEELCGVRPDMNLPQIKEILAQLYRRHNRMTSSLNPELRAEAEMMLDAIVDVRHKYFGERVGS